MFSLLVAITCALHVGRGSASVLSSPSFDISIDDTTGGIASISHPGDNASMSWISSPQNAPWQPLTSRWGLGFADLGASTLHRVFWNSPTITTGDGTHTAEYNVGSLRLVVVRTLDVATQAFKESYTFSNIGSTSLVLNSKGAYSLAIYTPFNDHYTTTADALEKRAHTHLWAGGGTSSWVKQTRMGGRGPHLGLVVTQGALSGYSVESRDTVTGSNTRGVFLLHPTVPTLAVGESTTLAWTMFWHEEWDDFFAQCAKRSTQFVRVEASTLTVYSHEAAQINVSGAAVGPGTTVNGVMVTAYNNGSTYSNSSTYSVTIPSLSAGEHVVVVSTSAGNSSIVMNCVPDYNTTIAGRTAFIAAHQQIPSNSTNSGAYVVYDNQLNAMVTFDTAKDRNSGRERVGMGNLMARWLRLHSDPVLQASLTNYYVFVCTQLQDSTGWVNNGPGDTSKRLYNWPWVMELHLNMAILNLPLPDVISSQSPIQRFMTTAENFYANGGTTSYAIGVPVFEGLRFLQSAGNITAYNRALALFTAHGSRLALTGTAYPAAEVNFEQSIVAPAAIFLLELYRATNTSTWLTASRPHLALLELFGGRQPDYHLSDVAIRHWDGYWFGKDRMWGDTFPHYWSMLSAVAFHHYAVATGDAGYARRADSILRSNLKNFAAGTGKASCAYLYPLSVSGRSGHYADSYANDQDWALVHLLQIKHS